MFGVSVIIKPTFTGQRCWCGAVPVSPVPAAGIAIACPAILGCRLGTGVAIAARHPLPITQAQPNTVVARHVPVRLGFGWFPLRAGGQHPPAAVGVRVGGDPHHPGLRRCPCGGGQVLAGEGRHNPIQSPVGCNIPAPIRVKQFQFNRRRSRQAVPPRCWLLCGWWPFAALAGHPCVHAHFRQVAPRQQQQGQQYQQCQYHAVAPMP